MQAHGTAHAAGIKYIHPKHSSGRLRFCVVCFCTIYSSGRSPAASLNTLSHPVKHVWGTSILHKGPQASDYLHSEW